jgi:hypothetical protein
MALRVMSMAEIRLEVLLEAARSGETVTEVCRRHGIDRKTYKRRPPSIGSRQRVAARSTQALGDALECRPSTGEPRLLGETLLLEALYLEPHLRDATLGVVPDRLGPFRRRRLALIDVPVGLPPSFLPVAGHLLLVASGRLGDLCRSGLSCFHHRCGYPERLVLGRLGLALYPGPQVSSGFPGPAKDLLA